MREGGEGDKKQQPGIPVTVTERGDGQDGLDKSSRVDQRRCPAGGVG